MPPLWSHFEVCWITPCINTNRFFDNRIDAEKYAARLAGYAFTKWVELRVHDSPHGGDIERVCYKGSYEEAIRS